MLVYRCSGVGKYLVIKNLVSIDGGFENLPLSKRSPRTKPPEPLENLKIYGDSFSLCLMAQPYHPLVLQLPSSIEASSKPPSSLKYCDRKAAEGDVLSYRRGESS